MKKVRIGSGAGYAGDRIEPALELIKKGNLDYIIFECLAERTIALAQKEKLKESNKGYNSLLEYRMSRVIPLLKEHPVKIVTNMGAANPVEAAKVTKKICEENNLGDLKVAYVLGDDLFAKLGKYEEVQTIESKILVKTLGENKLSANAYIGAQSIVDALSAGADIVITGRASDPSLTVGPAVYELGKSFAEIDFLAKATVAGHILECGAQVTGGYYANPPFKEVPELWNIGFPIVELSDNGDFTIEKLADSGGLLTTETVKEQLIYEIHDPENYLTPDVVVDFSKIVVTQQGDKVAVKGVTGKPKTRLLKVSIGYEAGYIAEGEISYGGSNAASLAALASEIIDHRLKRLGLLLEDARTDYIGIDSLYGKDLSNGQNELKEVRLRKAVRVNTKTEALDFCREVESLYTNGPAGGGGIRTRMNEIVALESILVKEEDADTWFEIL